MTYRCHWKSTVRRVMKVLHNIDVGREEFVLLEWTHGRFRVDKGMEIIVRSPARTTLLSLGWAVQPYCTTLKKDIYVAYGNH